MGHYTSFGALAVLLAVFSAFGAPASQASAAVQPAVKLSVTATSKAWWMGGRHIPLTVTVTNTGAPIKFPKPETYVMPDSVIDMTVTNAAGKHPERLIAGLYRSGGSATQYVHLAKGASIKIDLDKAGICNEYETLPSGSYALRFTLNYTDLAGHKKSTSATVPRIEVRDVRDFAVSSIAVVTPSFGPNSKLVDPNSTARAAIVAAPGGTFWLAYWIERDPILTDTQPATQQSTSPVHAADVRKWVTTLYWLGRVKKDAIFEVSRKVDNDLIVTFTDINSTKRAIEIDHFWAAPRYVKSPDAHHGDSPVTIDL